MFSFFELISILAIFLLFLWKYTINDSSGIFLGLLHKHFHPFWKLNFPKKSFRFALGKETKKERINKSLDSIASRNIREEKFIWVSLGLIFFSVTSSVFIVERTPENFCYFRWDKFKYHGIWYALTFWKGRAFSRE